MSKLDKSKHSSPRTPQWKKVPGGKLKKPVEMLWKLINESQYFEAEHQLKKYQRKYGHRHFGTIMRLIIKNGVWEHNCAM